MVYSTSNIKIDLKSMMILMILFYCINITANTDWEEVKSKMYYTELQTDPSGGKLHAFKFSPKDYQFCLDLARNHQKQSLTIYSFVKKNHALLGINGGFFTPHWEPLGLRIIDKEIKNAFKDISWWGITFLENNQLKFSGPKNFKDDNHQIEMALQSGPRLIINGEKTRLKPGTAERSALCTNKKNQILLIVSNHHAITLDEFATIIARPEQDNGLACYNALNLDGGSSSQLYSDIPKKRIFVSGLNQISDALLVKEKT